MTDQQAPAVPDGHRCGGVRLARERRRARRHPGSQGGQLLAIAVEQPHRDHAIASAGFLHQAVEGQLVVEVALADGEQGLLGCAGQRRSERIAALRHLRLEGAAFVLGGHQREAHARHHEKGDHESAEFDL